MALNVSLRQAGSSSARLPETRLSEIIDIDGASQRFAETSREKQKWISGDSGLKIARQRPKYLVHGSKKRANSPFQGKGQQKIKYIKEQASEQVGFGKIH